MLLDLAAGPVQPKPQNLRAWRIGLHIPVAQNNLAQATR